MPFQSSVPSVAYKMAPRNGDYHSHKASAGHSRWPTQKARAGIDERHPSTLIGFLLINVDMILDNIWHVTLDWLITGGSTSKQLRHVTVPIVSNSACNSVYGNIDSTQVCAGYSSGGKDSCQVRRKSRLIDWVEFSNKWIVSWYLGLCMTLS